VTKCPNLAGGKGGHDVTEHIEEGGCNVACDKLSTLKPGMDEKYLDGSYRCKNVTGQIVTADGSLGGRIVWVELRSVCGRMDRQGIKIFSQIRLKRPCQIEKTDKFVNVGGAIYAPKITVF
jgi:hypothetical protein